MRRAPCASIPAIGAAGDLDTAVVMLRHENDCITTIDNSRQAVYGYDQRVEVFGSGGMAASENPSTHTGIRRSAAGTIGSTIPYFFLDRYIPSYVEEWKSFVAYVANGGESPVTAQRRSCPAGDRARGVEVVPRSPPRALRRDRLKFPRQVFVCGPLGAISDLPPLTPPPKGIAWRDFGPAASHIAPKASGSVVRV